MRQTLSGGCVPGAPPMAGTLGRIGLDARGGKSFSPPAAWLRDTQINCSTVDDSVARWMEVSFRLPDWMTGDPVNGWFGPGIWVGLQWSGDLAAWETGGFYPAPGKPPEKEAGGWIRWHARHCTPAVWFNAVVDLEIESSLYGNSITAITAPNGLISLSYPYAMPGAAATLQSALRAAGWAGATVESTAGTLRCTIYNHNVTPRVLTATMSGADVVDVAPSGTTETVDLDYPYTMPAEKAALQADLRSAGWTYAVVRLFGDEWKIRLPNYESSGTSRGWALEFSPGDPYAGWDFMGNYAGEVAGNGIAGTSGNVRWGGVQRREAIRAFARLAS